MTAYKAKVKAVHPDAACRCTGDVWCVWYYAGIVRTIGVGTTAFLAWFDAWRNTKEKQ